MTAQAERMNDMMESNAAKTIFKVFGKRQRFRRHTNLDLFFKVIAQEDPSITEREFLEVFKTLQNQGAGSLVIGRKDNPTRFVWNYNLKEVANVARRGRGLQGLDPLPKRSKYIPTLLNSDKPKLVSQPEPIKAAAVPKSAGGVNITIQFPEGTRPEDMKALLELAASLNK